MTKTRRPAFSAYAAEHLTPAPMDLATWPYLATRQTLTMGKARAARLAALDLHILVSAGRMARALDRGRQATAIAHRDAMRAAHALKRARLAGGAQ